MLINKSENLAEVEITYKTKVKPSLMRKITSSKDSADILREIWNEDKIEHVEEVIILLLNRANKVLGWAKISTGGVAGTVIDPKVIFQIALNANASSIILSHNHPSGNLSASQEDKSITRKIQEGGKILEISILDHVILTTESYLSFADEGLI